MSSKVLIIASVFPPNPGIGGRRWAKFAKGISEDGYEIFVIKPESFSKETSLWSQDVSENKNLHVFSFNLFFQKILSNPYGNIFNKTFRFFFHVIFKKTKYYSWDTSSISMNRIKKNAIEIIKKEKISTVIISANPYYYYVGYLLKLYFKENINVVLDYRDLWNDHSYYKNFFKRTPKQIAYSNKIENLALNNCDYLLTVDKNILSILEKRITNPKVKKKVIPNGFDKDDYTNFLPLLENHRHDNKIRLFFAGSISADLNDVFKLFIDEFLKLKDSNMLLFNKFVIEINCNSNNPFINQLSAQHLPSNIIIKPANLSAEEYMSKLAASDYGLLFSSEEYSSSFFTKFYDYIYLRKRILNIGYKKGDLANFILNSNIGLNFIREKVENIFIDLEKDHSTNKNIYLSSVYINQFDVSVLKDEVIRVIEELEIK